MAVSGYKGEEVTLVTSDGSDATDNANDAIKVNVVAGGGAGGTASTFGAAFPGTGTAAGAMDVGGNMAAFNLDASGNLKVVSAGGGSAVSIADGADVVEGALADAAVVTDANGTVSGKLRGLVKILADVWDSGNHWLKVAVQGAVAVTQSGVWSVGRTWTLGSGTDSVNIGNFPATQTVAISQTGTNNDVDANITNVSLAVTNAGLTNLDVALSTRTKPADQQHTIVDSGTLTAVTTITNVVHVDDNGASLTVDGTVAVSNFPATQPISAASLPLPTNAAQETGGNLANLATHQTDGTQKTKITDGVTDATVVNLATNDALAVAIVDGAGDQITTFGGGTQYAAGIVEPTPTGTAIMGKVSDARESYIDNTIEPVSITSDGRVRVSSTPGDVYLDFFQGNIWFLVPPDLTDGQDLYNIGDKAPWP